MKKETTAIPLTIEFIANQNFPTLPPTCSTPSPTTTQRMNVSIQFGYKMSYDLRRCSLPGLFHLVNTATVKVLGTLSWPSALAGGMEHLLVLRLSESITLYVQGELNYPSS